MILLRLAFVCMACCATARAEDADGQHLPVGDVVLEQRATAEHALLDVGVVIFDAGIPPDSSTHGALGIFPEIRRAEARYLPVLLRKTLVDSNMWGAVRVLPETAVLPELLVTGTIERSDGRALRLAIRAEDATGRPWLDKVFLDETTPADYPVAPGVDPYADTYRAIANALLAVRDTLSEQDLQDIRRVAFLRYAASLSPEAFAGYLAGGGEQAYRVSRLPAEGDPMIARVERIRNQEYLFIDTVDEQYLSLRDEMAETYNLWRQYDRERALYLADYEQRAADRGSQGRRGSFAAMQQSYNAYRSIKIQEQDLGELALGFNNEVAPTVVEVSGRVFRLNGTLDSQYGDWRRILREIFALETGLQGSQ